MAPIEIDKYTKFSKLSALVYSHIDHRCRELLRMSAWPSQTSRTGAPSAHVTGAVFPHPPLGPQKMPPKMDAVPPKMDAECVTCRKRHRAALTLPVCVCARACVSVCECVSAFVNNVYIHARAITTGVLSTYTYIYTNTCVCVCVSICMCV